MDTYALTRGVLKWLAGSSIPAHWFYSAIPDPEQRQKKSGQLTIEIVSHCWKYSRLQAYQLSSLVQHPVERANIVMTVFYSSEDESSAALLDYFSKKQVSNVTWNFKAIEKEILFRRAIGRNIAARESAADWVWFTDCDMTFQKNCLDSLSDALQNRTDALVYPRIESKTEIFTDDDFITSNALETPRLLLADTDRFIPHEISRATGPLQITHGDVARHSGYCDEVECYQQPAERFQKATEDRVFRWLLGTQGTAIDVQGVCRIQHVHKGRYKENSKVSVVRRGVRQLQHIFRQS